MSHSLRNSWSTKNIIWLACVLLLFISICMILLNINQINDYYGITAKELILFSTITGCEFVEPYPELQMYHTFDENFKRIPFDYEKSIKYIKWQSETNCISFEYGLIYNNDEREIIDMNNNYKIAIITMFIPHLYDNRTMKLNPYHDIRIFTMRMENAIRFCEINNYVLIYFNKKIWNYTGNNISYQHYLNMYGHWQKPFMINYFLDAYDWILYVDFDTMFYDCHTPHSLENNVIKYAINLHAHHTENGSLISLIFAKEMWYYLLNTGCFMIKNNEWSHQILTQWMYITDNAHKYIPILYDGKTDQKIISALLQGFDYKKKDKKLFLFYWNKFARSYYEKNKENNPNIPNNKKSYLFPIFDANMSHYAVAIDQKTMNENIASFLKSKTILSIIRQNRNPTNKNKSTVIVHFYGNQKNDKSIWHVLRYVLDKC
eukprot:144906_1